MTSSIARPRIAALIVSLAITTAANAQTQARTDTASRTPAPGPAIRKLESAVYVSKEPLGAVSSIRPLSNGRVLVNDGTRRRLLLLDSTLTLSKVVLDSITISESAYGPGIGYILPYRGDTTIFIDRGAYAMLMLDRDGHIARVRSVPSTTLLSYYAVSTGSSYGDRKSVV